MKVEKTFQNYEKGRAFWKKEECIQEYGSWRPHERLRTLSTVLMEHEVGQRRKQEQ